MKMWGLSLISIGCILIMMAYGAENVMPNLVSGITLAIIGIILTIKGKK